MKKIEPKVVKIGANHEFNYKSPERKQSFEDLEQGARGFVSVKARKIFETHCSQTLEKNNYQFPENKVRKEALLELNDKKK